MKKVFFNNIKSYEDGTLSFDQILFDGVSEKINGKEVKEVGVKIENNSISYTLRRRVDNDIMVVADGVEQGYGLAQSNSQTQAEVFDTAEEIIAENNLRAEVADETNDVITNDDVREEVTTNAPVITEKKAKAKAKK